MWGEKAIELAQQVDDVAVQAHALNTTGIARWLAPPFDNSGLLESLKLAREHDLPAQVSRALSNLVSGHLHRLEFAEAGRYLEEGLAFCAEHDMLTPHTWLLAHRAVRNLELGQWAEAEDDAERALDFLRPSTLAQVLEEGRARIAPLLLPVASRHLSYGPAPGARRRTPRRRGQRPESAPRRGGAGRHDCRDNRRYRCQWRHDAGYSGSHSGSDHFRRHWRHKRRPHRSRPGSPTG